MNDFKKKGKMIKMKIKLGVIFGGRSVEHEISIITANQAMSNINQDKYIDVYSLNTLNILEPFET